METDYPTGDATKLDADSGQADKSSLSESLVSSTSSSEQPVGGVRVTVTSVEESEPLSPQTSSVLSTDAECNPGEMRLILV